MLKSCWWWLLLLLKTSCYWHPTRLRIWLLLLLLLHRGRGIDVRGGKPSLLALTGSPPPSAFLVRFGVHDHARLKR